MAAYTYTKINWENEPSYNTPINETNLNHMDQGIFDLAYVKAEKEDAVFVNSISLDRKAGTSVGLDSVAAGYDTEASGPSSMAIGTNTSAKNGQAFAGGYFSKALGNTSLAFGTNCITRINSFESIALGNNCIAGSANQMVFGQYNVEDTTGTYAEIVGNGSSGNESNARTLDWQGNETIAGDFTNGNGETLHGIYEALPVDTETGNPTVITDAFGGACKSLKLTLEPIQSGSGTPSPDNVRPISGRTQSVVTRTGKNLIDWKINAYSSYLEKALPVGSYILSAETTLANGNWYIKAIKPDGSFCSKEELGVTSFQNASESGLYYGGASSQILTFSIATNNTTVRIGRLDANGTINAQLEIGSTATSYEAYTGESITRTYGTTIYGGSDNVTGDGATKTKDLYVPVVTTVGYSSNAGTWYADCYGVTIVEDTLALCNMYDQIGHGDTGANGKFKVYANAFTIYDSRFTDVATAQGILDNCQIVYPLATPTSIPLTAQNITLLHGDNVLTTDADSIEVSYSADIALYIEKKIAEGSQNNRSLSKGGSSDEEVKEEEKKEEEEIEEPKKEETR